MRKLFVVVIVVLLSLTFCFALMACDAATGDTGKDYDDAIKDLQDQLDTLKNSLSDTQDALDTANTEIANLQNYFAAGGKIYSVGETATVYSNGIKLLEVTLTELGDPSITFTLRNLSSAPLLTKEIFFVKSIRSDATFTTDNSFTSTILPNVPKAIMGIPKINSLEYLYVGFPSGAEGVIPYAIFKVPSL